MADIPTIAWDESSPPGSQGRALVDVRIREMKTQLREIIGVDHHIESSGSGDEWGFHDKVTFEAQASDPLPSTDAMRLYSKDVSDKPELHCVDEDDNIQQLTSGLGFSGGFTNEIRLWYGNTSDIPAGWAICDGGGGRPNLYDTFLKSIPDGVTEPETKGGYSSINLLTVNLPAHTHTFSTAANHAHGDSFLKRASANNIDLLTPYLGSYFTNFEITSPTDADHTHTFGATGSGVTIDNTPAHYELIFLIRT